MCGVSPSITRTFDKINALADSIFRDIQNLLETPTKPPKKPPDAAAYAITVNDVHNEMRDELIKADANAIECGELEGMHIGAGYGAKLSTKQLRQATIAGDIASIIIDSGVSSTCVKPPAEEKQTSECGEYTWNEPFTPTGK